jgi:nucleotide-binding universal stress UspA family protein
MADAGELERSYCGGGGGGGGGHFLVVAYGLQGHLNPARTLARRLARIHGARVTLSVTVAAHGRMFPSLRLSSPDEEVSDGLISYAPYSDGFEFGATPRDADQLARSTRESARSLSAIVRRFAAAGRPVTCVVSAFSLPAADVAAEHGIPLAVYWIQAAAALAVYYHYFHGYEQLVASHAAADPTYEVTIPGLRRPLRIRDFPSFLVDASGREQGSVRWFRSLFEHIDRNKPKILVNTPLDVLEATALEELKRKLLDVFAVGPMLPPHHSQQQQLQADADEILAEDRIHLYKQDDQKRYMEWLETKPARSVVYMSYGSMLSYDRH